jgi:hypothetical protein
MKRVMMVLALVVFAMATTPTSAAVTDCYYDSSSPDDNWTHALAGSFEFRHYDGSITYTDTYFPMMGYSSYSFTQTTSILESAAINPPFVPFNVLWSHHIYWLWSGEEHQFAHTIGYHSSGMPVGVRAGDVLTLTKNWTSLGYTRYPNTFVYYQSKAEGYSQPFSIWLRTDQLPTQ